jgi:hypothetical protein
MASGLSPGVLKYKSIHSFSDIGSLSSLVKRVGRHSAGSSRQSYSQSLVSFSVSSVIYKIN